MRVLAILGLFLAMASSSLAQQRVDERRAAARDGTGKIFSETGSLRVIGWDRDSVAVTGTLGAGGRAVELVTDDRATKIHVPAGRAELSQADSLLLLAADLEIRVPSRSFLAVRTTTAGVDVEGVTGGIDVESETGDITIRGDPRGVYAESAGGDIEILGRFLKLVRVKTVDGAVRVTGVRGLFEVSTISGDADVSGERVSQGEITTVSGAIKFAADFDRAAMSFLFESHSGTIELRLPASVAGDFDVTTIAGQIENEFRRGSSSEFTVGRGGPRVRVKSFKGSIRILRR